jgi:DNA topoisomerase III
MKKLIIAEKKSVADAIRDAFGGFGNGYERDDVVIAFAAGHLVGIEVPADKAQDFPCLPEHFLLKPEPERNKQELLRQLEQQLHRNDVSEIINACDAAREGELIFRLIMQYAQCDKPISRMWLKSMTEQAIIDAYEQRKTDAQMQGLANAAHARQQSDWLIGINGSKLMKQFAGEKTPVGRVLSPTVHLIVRRELDIRNFISVEFYEIHATIALNSGRFIAKWHTQQPIEDCPIERIYSPQAVSALVDALEDKEPANMRDTNKVVKKQPPLLFDLTSLQREANKHYGLTAAQTLEIAQYLYTQKFLTYPRTDYSCLPEDYAPQIESSLRALQNYAEPFAEIIEPIFANGWLQPGKKRIFNDAKVGDHFAIVPTEQVPSLNDFASKPSSREVYELVIRRTLAAFYPDAQISQTVREFELGEELFVAKGEVLLDEGWLPIYQEQSDNEATQLPLLGRDEQGELRKIDPVVGHTTPPKRYTEASLLGAMEKAGRDIDDEVLRDSIKEKGIGTPATRAAMIEKAISYEYVFRQGKQFVPNDTAIYLSESLAAIGASMFLTAETTARWETELAAMERGEIALRDYLDNMRTSVAELVVNALRSDAWGTRRKAQPLAQCPKCGGGMYGKALSFSCENNIKDEDATCDFYVRKTIAGHLIDESDLRTLLSVGRTKVLNGLMATSGKKFNARLKLNPETFKTDFEFEEPDTHPCPACGKRLFRRSKPGKGQDQGYDFWGCEGYRDKSCNASFDNYRNKPVFRK